MPGSSQNTVPEDLRLFSWFVRNFGESLREMELGAEEFLKKLGSQSNGVCFVHATRPHPAAALQPPFFPGSTEQPANGHLNTQSGPKPIQLHGVSRTVSLSLESSNAPASVGSIRSPKPETETRNRWWPFSAAMHPLERSTSQASLNTRKAQSLAVLNSKLKRHQL